MNKKGFFFFIEWGTSTKQEILSIKPKFKCSCKGNYFHLIYNFKRGHVFWIIPVEDWKLEQVFMQCVKCGLIYKLEGKEEENAIKIYEDTKEIPNNNKLEADEDYDELEDTEDEIEETTKKIKPTKKKLGKKKETWLNNFKNDLKNLGRNE